MFFQREIESRFFDVSLMLLIIFNQATKEKGSIHFSLLFCLHGISRGILNDKEMENEGEKTRKVGPLTQLPLLTAPPP